MNGITIRAVANGYIVGHMNELREMDEYVFDSMKDMLNFIRDILEVETCD